jgi:Serine dehydrogenase proteinase
MAASMPVQRPRRKSGAVTSCPKDAAGAELHKRSAEASGFVAADEIVLGEFSVLGPIDPQIAGLPAASIVKARDSKPVSSTVL